MWLQVIRLLSIPFKAPPAEKEKYFFDVNCYVSSAVAVIRSLLYLHCWYQILLKWDTIDDNVFRLWFDKTTYLEKGTQPILSSCTQFLGDHYMAQVWFSMQRWLDSGCCLLRRMCYCSQVKSAINRKNESKTYIHIQ